EQIGDRTDVLGAGAGLTRLLGALPRFRLFQHEHDGNDQERRHDADAEEDPPARGAEDEIALAGLNSRADDRSDEVAHRRKGLQDAESHRTESTRDAL